LGRMARRACRADQGGGEQGLGVALGRMARRACRADQGGGGQGGCLVGPHRGGLEAGVLSWGWLTGRQAAAAAGGASSEEPEVKSSP
jgi:hypothetical protein